MTGEEELERLAAEVLASSKYKMVDGGLVRKLGRAELGRRRNVKEAIKATKNKLHQIAGAYWTGKVQYNSWLTALAATASDASAFRQTCLTIMAHHASTRERLPILDEFYPTIFAGLPPVSTVVDLACGFNPLAISWMPLPLGAAYYACDIYHDQVAFLNGFFDLAGVQGEAYVCDLLAGAPPLAADIALLLKTIPCLEQIDKTVAERLFATVNAPVLIVSFPARSLGGRDKGMLTTYEAHFDSLIEHGSAWRVEKIEFDSELVFRLFRRPVVLTQTEPA
jgi:16S rRNA (guanine(1405)-N(7))-methyltransferase